MSNSGAKLSTTEYATRKVIDVISAIAIPVVSFGAIYVIGVHGEKIANSISAKIQKIRNRRKK